MKTINSFIARQPIFDTDMKVYAYELLYRDDDRHNAFNGKTDWDQASTEVMIRSFHGIGIDSLTGGRRAFINFTTNLIIGNYATLFPNDLLVVELLETIAPTEEIVEACKAIKKGGYLLALDDFRYGKEFQPLVDIADIIKVDFIESTIDEIQELLRLVDVKRIKLLAEKIETKEIFELAKAMGFVYFQGYFFSKPVIVPEKTLEPLKVNYLRLIRYVNKDEMDIERVASVIKYDVALSFRLLRLVNSAYFGMRNRIVDIQHALAILGENETRKWVTLITMMGLQDGKPDEIIRMSMIRARFMELLGMKVNFRIKADQMHLVGLFSLIDVIMDRPKEEVLEQIKLPEQITNALITGKGMIATALNMIVNYERGNWDDAMKGGASLGLSRDDVIKNYLDSVVWCSSMII